MKHEQVEQGLWTVARLVESASAQSREVVALADRFAATLRNGGTLFFAGNGGSAADAQHLAAEYVVRYARSRRALAAVALTTDGSLLTAAGNDLRFEEIYARQVEALCRPGDLLVLHSTSGRSPNLIRAAQAARAKGVGTVAFLGKGGGELAGLVDEAFVVASDVTSHIQTLHMVIEHLIVELVEDEVADAP